ncbi:MAG: helix-turn-helix domain-containing protein [Flavobacterium circumlabens]|uniref:DNA-binding protein n=1 Tax=Flavobacterium circumlabens TaxID=2133765 RepID=A0A4Y7UHN2_9FLAO|nr:helix-turn-helix domain-containing protein [Flavobacterium circumlabens]TCN60832.1 excisionase family DNA binding protein [Flavobacterium circumlabens]TEB45965.1 DNA-binding protein [Flavobacterium circumlabens]
MTNVLQLENTNALDFKNEIVKEVVAALKGFANTLQPDNEKLLTREETAKMLSVSLVTLWDWTRKDLIPAYRIGNKVRYKKSEVSEALKKMNKFSS